MKIDVKIKAARFVLATTLGFYMLTIYNSCSKVSFAPSGVSALTAQGGVAAVLINNGAPYTNQVGVTLTLNSPGASEMYVTNDPSCKTGGNWQPYIVSLPWTLPDSNKQNSVFAQFRNMSSLSPCSQASIVHDNIAPLGTFNNFADYTNQNHLEVPIAAQDSGSGIASVVCTEVNTGFTQDCQNGFAIQNLSEGPYHLSVLARDHAGNVSIPQEQSWTVDITAPVVTIVTGPSLITNQTQAVFVINASDNFSPAQNIKLSCKVDGGSFQPCTTTPSFAVSQGPHTLSVIATDLAQNTSTPIVYKWSVDITVLNVTLTKVPSPVSGDLKQVFGFQGSPQVVTFLCQLDSGAQSVCVSPLNYGRLPDGPHTFKVTGQNQAGDQSQPTTYSWIVDTTPPVVSISSQPPASTNNPNGTVIFNVTDQNPSGSAICVVDQQAAQNCVNSIVLQTLPEGPHQVTITTVDQGGNSSTPVTAQWTIDLTPPVVTIVSGPDKITQSQSAPFILNATDANGGKVSQIQCKLDSQATFSSCTLTPQFSNLSNGNHTFSVKGVDQAGNISAQVDYPWTVSTNGPSITFQQQPQDPSSVSSPAVVQYSVSDTVFPGSALTITCGFNGQVTSCADQATLSHDQTLGTQTFTVNAKNPAGLTSTQTITWTAKSILQFPSLSNLAAIAFEDNFPSVGDADYNDFLTNFKITEAINTQNQITQITIDFYPRAVGAGFDHSLILVLDGVKDSPSNITKQTTPLFNGDASIVLMKYDGSGNLKSKQNYSKGQDVVVFQSTHDAFGDSGQVNTNPGAPYIAPLSLARVQITLHNPEQNAVASNSIDTSKFRVILHVSNTNKDIDIIDVDPSNFDSNGYPFGFIIPSDWQWPVEGKAIDNSYPNFAAYRKFLVDKNSDPTVTAPPSVLNWFLSPVPNDPSLYPRVQAPTKLP